jgi:hypothetical protein
MTGELHRLSLLVILFKSIKLHMAAIEILCKLSSFREDILEIDPLETRIACGGHVCSFHSDPLTNMATIGNSCFWLVDF